MRITIDTEHLSHLAKEEIRWRQSNRDKKYPGINLDWGIYFLFWINDALISAHKEPTNNLRNRKSLIASMWADTPGIYQHMTRDRAAYLLRAARSRGDKIKRETKSRYKIGTLIIWKEDP